MTKRRTLTDEATYNGHQILTNKQKGLKCDKKILKKLDDTFEHVFKDHNMDRLFFMRYDVRMPDDGIVRSKQEANKLFRTFQGKFIKNLERKGLNPHYVAVREQSKEKHAHYHAVLLLDERKTQSIHQHIEKADKLWENTLGAYGKKGLIDDCTKDRDGNSQKNGIKIKKNSPEFKEQIDNAFQWSSYLAKENTKTTGSERELFSSRLKHPIEKKKRGSKQ
jgi:hypothetical protein